MSVLITFLLISAVWTQVSMIQMGSSIAGKKTEEKTSKRDYQDGSPPGPHHSKTGYDQVNAVSNSGTPLAIGQDSAGIKLDQIANLLTGETTPDLIAPPPERIAWFYGCEVEVSGLHSAPLKSLLSKWLRISRVGLVESVDLTPIPILRGKEK